MITTTTIAVRQGTAEDLPAVRRFWYEVYCEQMGRLTDVADHALRELVDPLDRGSRIALAVDGETGIVVGTLMNTLCAETSVGHYAHLYAMDRPDVNLGTASISLKLGWRPHAGWIEHPACGHVFSMALHLDDREYLEALNSPFLWTALDKH